MKFVRKFDFAGSMPDGFCLRSRFTLAVIVRPYRPYGISLWFNIATALPEPILPSFAVVAHQALREESGEDLIGLRTGHSFSTNLFSPWRKGSCLGLGYEAQSQRSVVTPRWLGGAPSVKVTGHR